MNRSYRNELKKASKSPNISHDTLQRSLTN